MAMVSLLSFNLPAQLQDAKVFFGRSVPVGSSMAVSPYYMHGQGWLRAGPARFEEEEGDGRLVRLSLGFFIGNGILFKNDFTYWRHNGRSFSTSAFEINPALRIYLNPAADKTYFFGELGFGYFKKDFSSNEDVVSSEFGLGFTHFLAPMVAVDGLFSFSRESVFEDFRISNYLLSAGINIFLGGENESPSATQLEKGTIALGLSELQFGIFRNDIKATSFFFRPQALYFLSDHFAVGADVQFDYDRQRVFTAEVVGTEQVFEGFETNTALALATVLRYQTTNGKRSAFFLEGGVGYQIGRDTRDRLNLTKAVTVSQNGLLLIVNTGFNIFLTKRVALEIGPEINHDPERDETDFSLSTGFQVFLR
ncbi:MAG: hypothetical protein AAFR36_23290 [Bacteroidota bacterium]